MKILFAPVAHKNPYQSSLKAYLEAMGGEVSLISDNRPRRFLQQALSGSSCDVLHLHWTDGYILDDSLSMSLVKSTVFLASLYVHKLKGGKVVWTLHNLGEHERRHPGLEKHVHGLLLKLCDRVIVHSDYCRDTALRFWSGISPDKFRVVPHGSYVGIYPNEISREEARDVLNLPPDKKVVLLFGLLRGYKGFEDLIELFHSKPLHDVILLIAGKPANDTVTRRIEELAEGCSNIRLVLKYIPDSEIQQYMNACDAVVYSFMEIFTSGSVILAMSFGKAIIAPALPALESLITSGGIRSYKPNDMTDLKKQIIDLQQTEVDKLGDLNYQAVLPLNWQRVAKETFQIYNNTFDR